LRILFLPQYYIHFSGAGTDATDSSFLMSCLSNNNSAKLTRNAPYTV
jgi:hypothetical protein